MIFPKETRKLIYQAKAKPVRIEWPKGEPQKGHKYTIQSRSRDAGRDTLLVLNSEEVADAVWEALVKLDGDPVRTLHISARKAREPNPMGGPQFGPEYESEQVDSRYQRLITEEGRLKTVLRGATRRQQDKVLQAETAVAAARREGKPTALAEARRDRAQRRLAEAA